MHARAVWVTMLAAALLAAGAVAPGQASARGPTAAEPAFTCGS